MPTGKTLFVVISRSLCECHINAQPRSLAGLAWVLDGSNVVQLALGGLGVPPYHWPFVKTFGSGSVAGPPAATSPKGATCTGLLWSWHHSMKLTAFGAPEL